MAEALLPGDGSESRYDGESMAHKGIVALTINYRFGVFGLLSHPELDRGITSTMHPAIMVCWISMRLYMGAKKYRSIWRRSRIRVTIAGESAGSICRMRSNGITVIKRLIAGAIGESGGILPDLAAIPLAEGEKGGVNLQQKLGAKSLADLRAMPADKLLDLASRQGGGSSMAISCRWLFPA